MDEDAPRPATGEATTTPAAPAASSRRSWGRALRFIRSTLLNIAAVGGALCIILVLLALVFDITIVMFRTGSMAPTIPAGSAALVREVPADQVQVGDVVTVDRPGRLPITHRVVAATDLPGDDVKLVLQGDANDAPDPTPYVVQTVRTVLFSVPGAAYVIAWLDDPIVLAGLTLAIALLVAWVFWPSRTESEHEQGRPSSEVSQ